MRFYKNVLTLPRQSHTIKTYNLLHRSKALRRLSCVQGKGMVMKMIEYYHELEEPELLTLQDEEGVESVVELLAQMDVDGKSYVAATPHLDDPTQALGEDAELIVLVSEEEDGEEFLASIDDDDEYEKIGNLFLEKLMGYYEGEEEAEEE